MSLAVRVEDRALAIARRSDAALWHPEHLMSATFKVWRACVDAEIRRLGLRLHNEGPIADSIASRGLALTRRDIFVNDGPNGDYTKWDSTIYCPFFTHETRHPLEARVWKPAGTFQSRYVFRVRFRWAVEMQAQIAVVRWRRKMGSRRANVLREAEATAASFARPFPGYNMGRIRNLRGETVGLLMRVFDEGL